MGEWDKTGRSIHNSVQVGIYRRLCIGVQSAVCTAQSFINEVPGFAGGTIYVILPRNALGSPKWKIMDG